MRFDLQAHSTHSDGTLPPDEVLARAAAAGVELLALTDHDSIAGVHEAVRAGARHGVDVVPAIELSSLHGTREDLHILGYGVDASSPQLARRLTKFRADREARADRMLDALRQLGFALDEHDLDERRIRGASIGRPHIAAAVFDHPDNTERLEREGLDTSVRVLQAYLIPGTPAYRGRTIPSVSDAIATIHDAGGVAVWAHPFWDVSEPADVIAHLDVFQGWGLDGVEVFYATHTPAQVELLAATCRDRRLLSTGSSDFHGPEHPLFSTFLSHHLHGFEPDLGPIPDMARRATRDATPPT